MTEAKFTPGPWRWEPEPDPDSWHHDMGEFLGRDGKRVCWFGDGERYCPTEGEPPSDADAHLIAAAPDLYGVAEALIYALDKSPPKDMMKAIVLAGDKARSALAKARGE